MKARTEAPDVDAAEFTRDEIRRMLSYVLEDTDGLSNAFWPLFGPYPDAKAKGSKVVEVLSRKLFFSQSEVRAMLGRVTANRGGK